jgi:S-(hydroxymethyl)glutathione dehydrogenase/alcohol dehydrogenase
MVRLMKFNAAVLIKQNAPLEIHELKIPSLRFGQVLVRVSCSGICGSQLGEIAGVKGPDRFLPHLLGHEGFGQVLEVGEGVQTVASGDAVVMHWRPGTGLQAPPPVYASDSLGQVNAGWITTFNELAVVSENRVTKVPAETDPEVGALMGCAVTTGLGVVNNNACLKIGQSIVVWGAGGIGLNIIQGASMVAANPVIGIDLFDEKLELACTMGATHIINAKECDPVAKVQEILGSDGDVISKCYKLTKSTGRTVLVGVPAKGAETFLHTLPLHFEKTLSGSHGGESVPERDIPNYLNLVKAGKLDLSRLVTERFSLAEINSAIVGMRDGSISGRCLISMK